MPSPLDILDPGSEEPLPDQSKYVLLARTGAILISRPDGSPPGTAARR
jgi:hypothetical protein